MKYLKKFNEELKSSTYFRASKKLDKLGHKRRAGVLGDYAKSVQEKEEEAAWKNNIEKYSKWGKVKIGFYEEKERVFEGEFYPILDFNEDCAEENFLDVNRKGDFEFDIEFSLGLIPVDEDTNKLCKISFPEPDMSNGFYWGLWFKISYKIENEKLHFVGLSYYPYDESLTLDPKIVDRRGALVIKKILKAAVDENEAYPSGYSDDPIMHDKIFKLYCQKFELMADYDFNLERVVKDIESVSHNTLFKD